MKILLTVILSTFNSWLYGQSVAVGNSKFNIAFKAFDNPIEVAIEKTNCDSIFVTTSNGYILGDKCLYIFKPFEIGYAELKIL